MDIFEFKKRQIYLISENQILKVLDEVITYCEYHYQKIYFQAIHQKRRFLENEGQKSKGLLADMDHTLVLNQISNALLQLLEQDWISDKDSKPQPRIANSTNLLNRIPTPGNKFIGREEELSIFEKAMAESTILSVEGVGGIGKTDFVIECIRRFVVRKESVIWVSPLMHFDIMLHQAGYGDMLRIEQQDEFMKFRNFEGLLDKDECIMVLEDFHDNTDGTYYRFFENISLSKAKIIIISRFLPPGLEVHKSIRLESLGENALQFAKEQRGKKNQYEEIAEESLAKLCKAVEGHPLSIELGVQLLSYGEDPDNIIQVFAKGEYQHLEKVSSLSRRLLYGVLHNPRTSEAERDLLIRFSIFRDKVPFEAIASLYEEASIRYPLSQLLEKSLIRFKHKLYDCAPLIREFCRAELTNLRLIHSRAATYFLSLKKPVFDPALEDHIIYHLKESANYDELIRHLKVCGHSFLRSGQVNLLKETIEYIKAAGYDDPEFGLFEADIYTHLCRFKEAALKAEGSLDWYSKSGDNRNIARALICLGRIYWMTDFKKSRPILEEGFNYSLTAEDNAITIAALNLIANAHFEEGNTKSAIEKAKEGLDMAVQSGNRHEEAVALNTLGRIGSLQGAYDEALTYFSQSHQIFDEIHHQVMAVTALNNMATLQFKTGNYSEALDVFKRCFEMENAIGSRYQTGKTMNNIAIVLIRMNQYEEAERTLMECLQIHEEIRYQEGKAVTLRTIGQLFSIKGHYNESLNKYQESLQICREIGYHLGVPYILDKIGELYLAGFDPPQFSETARWLLEALLLREKMNLSPQITLDLLVTLKDRMPDAYAFHEVMESAYEKMEPELKNSIPISRMKQVVYAV